MTQWKWLVEHRSDLVPFAPSEVLAHFDLVGVPAPERRLLYQAVLKFDAGFREAKAAAHKAKQKKPKQGRKGGRHAHP